MPPYRRHVLQQLFAVLCAFALLVSDTAAGLASGLARSLALTAAAFFCALTQVASLDGLDMLHNL
jgi:hypothetical protein